MFNNYFFFLHRFLFVYAVNNCSWNENQKRQKSVSACHTPKKSEPAKKIAIGASLLRPPGCLFNIF